MSRKHDGKLFRYTYKDAYERVQRLANSLSDIGIQIGDKVGVLAWNTYEHYEIFFGLPGTGAVMLLLNVRLAPQELSYVINHAKAKFIIVDETLLSVAEAIIPQCKTLRGYILITDKKLNSVETELDPIYSYEEILAKAKPQYNWPNINENSAYSSCYTSGTTGRPKGVYYSHRDVYLQAMIYAIKAMISVKDCLLQIVPMFHVLGWGTPQAATLAGAKLVFPGRYSLKNIKELINLMVQEHITLSNGAPSILMPILEHIRKMDQKPDFSGVRIISGASEPPISLMKGLWELTGAEIIHSYGSTEANAIVTLNISTPWLDKELSQEEIWDLKRKQGQIVTGLDVKIVNESGKKLPHDGKSTGEILFKGPWISSRYYNAPGTEHQFTKDGYYKSGDIGNIDSEGFLKITDRRKDLIKSAGEWISSVDMENSIVSHPAVAEAAVIGCPHPKWEERPLALVVLRVDMKNKVNKAEIFAHLAENFAKWQLPDEILFVDRILKTSVGKIDKKNIRIEYRGFYTDRKS